MRSVRRGHRRRTAGGWDCGFLVPCALGQAPAGPVHLRGPALVGHWSVVPSSNTWHLLQVVL